jgi:hypothetical protein
VNKRLYFEVFSVDGLKEHDTWIVRPQVEGLIESIALAERIASKVLVLDVRVHLYSMLVGPRTPGEFFSGDSGIRLAHHVRPGQSIEIKIERREETEHGHFRTFAVLELDDCVRYYDRGAERYAIGWVDIL